MFRALANKRFTPGARQARLLGLLLTLTAAALVVFVFDTSSMSDADPSRHSLIPAERAPPPPVHDTAATQDVERAASEEADYVQPTLVHPVSGKAVRAKIVTCPACRLNSLPKVKKFVKQEAQWFSPGLEVEFIFGKDPHMFLFQDDEQTEDIDLSPLDSAKIMKTLVAFGIHPNRMNTDIRAALGEKPPAEEAASGAS